MLLEMHGRFVLGEFNLLLLAISSIGGPLFLNTISPRFSAKRQIPGDVGSSLMLQSQTSHSYYKPEKIPGDVESSLML